MTRSRPIPGFTTPNRRAILAGLAAFAATPAVAEAMLDASAAGLTPNLPGDQTTALRSALERAAAEGRPLFLPGGTYVIDGLDVPGGTTLTGVQGATILVAGGNGAIARIGSSRDVVLDCLAFSGGPTGGPQGEAGLLEIERSREIIISRCRFGETAGSGIVVRESAATIDRCVVEGVRHAGILSLDSIGGVIVTGCRIMGCGNAGVQVWGSAPGHRDGSIVTGNSIKAIFAEGGGNGQNGNGINVFNADNVIVADNQIDDCMFTAVRLNATNNAQVRGNTCTRCGEVAIFSEFGFSGSVIAGNIVDGAATGISITNLDSGGRLAVCSGNIVRNIMPSSPVNPDTRPVGIFAEAETAITGNVVDAVPGVGIMAGWGPYLRNVAVSDNVLYGTHIGIGVSVVTDPAPGPVRIDGNMIYDPLDHAIAGMAWEEVVSDDLVRDAARFPHVSVGDNTVSRP